MTIKLAVGPIDTGLTRNRLAFNINNDAFPKLVNAYQFRGRIKRKRGTQFITRFARFFNSLSLSYSSTATITLNGSGIGNIITGFGLESTGNIIPGTVTITSPGPVYTDPAMNGSLSPSGSINYATGVVTIVAQSGNAISVVYDYYPTLPVMGLRNYKDSSTEFSGEIAFDPVYSYRILTTKSPTINIYPSYDVSFYKNPPVTTSYPGYIQKTIVSPTRWNGKNYQQFWTVTYLGVLWATNGINVPFNVTNIGMQFKNIAGIAVLTPTTANLNIVGHGLTVGDFVYVNQVPAGTTTGINHQTGYVTTVIGADNVIVTFPNAALAGGGGTGIAQYLTRQADPTKDCIRWYDGDPTDGNYLNPTLNGNNGWVNFCPPLIQPPSNTDFSIDEITPGIYYLVGARMIVPFKNRLLFVGPVIQTSSEGSQRYLQDVIIYCQDGTPFYTASFQGDPRFPTTIIPILTPGNTASGFVTSLPSSFFEDSTGYGGFVTADLNEDALTCESNEDNLIVGFTNNQTRLVFTGNDILPFEFYLINSELGSSSTFSSINMDDGVITRGARGFIKTNQNSCFRIDLDIPDQVFQIDLTNNGIERFTSGRDFQSEWIYFTYNSNNEGSAQLSVFPTQTLFYNYRDNSWAIFNESYTTYGQFGIVTGDTWSTIGYVYRTWSRWNVSWDSGYSTLNQPEVIAGNSQGFVVMRIQGTGESESLAIQSFSGSEVVSPDHCLNSGDYITISSCIGTIGVLVNDKIFSITTVTQNSFFLLPSIGTGTYFGGGLITRMYIPFIQTKQFPMAWGDGRKTRIGVQRYLLTTTNASKIQLLIFLSQNDSSAYNTGLLVPSTHSVRLFNIQ